VTSVKDHRTYLHHRIGYTAI